MRGNLSNVEEVEIYLQDIKSRLIEAETIEELNLIRAEAKGVKPVVRALRGEIWHQNLAVELRLSAERKLGMLIIQEIQQGGDRREGSRNRPMTLSDLNVSADMSFRWRQIARIPQEVFSEYFNHVNEGEFSATRTGLVNFCQVKPRSATTR